MARPKKKRTVYHIHMTNQFVPDECKNKKIVYLDIDEMEAIRLMDLEGHDQITSGNMMGLARTTFQRVLTNARKKIATALVEGLPIMLRGIDKNDESIVYHCPDCDKNYTYKELCEGNCPHCKDRFNK